MRVFYGSLHLLRLDTTLQQIEVIMWHIFYVCTNLVGHITELCVSLSCEKMSKISICCIIITFREFCISDVFVTQYITCLNIWEVLSGTLSPLWVGHGLTMGTRSLKALPIYSSMWCTVLQTDSYNSSTSCYILKYLWYLSQAL